MTKKRATWTDDEVKILRKYYPRLGYKIPGLLKKYTYIEISNQAAYQNLKRLKIRQCKNCSKKLTKKNRYGAYRLCKKCGNQYAQQANKKFEATIARKKYKNDYYLRVIKEARQLKREQNAKN